MSEWVNIRRHNIDIRGVPVAEVKAGDKYQICTPNFTGPWRTAEEDAMFVRGKWGVRDKRPRSHKRGLFQL